MIHIDTYRIGALWVRQGGRRMRRYPHWRTPWSCDLWGRTWQAEWEGCQRAPRAWTERGVYRRAFRALTAEGPGGDEPDPEQATEADLLDDLLRARLGECSECHQIGACAYDAEGRPMIHVSEDRDG